MEGALMSIQVTPSIQEEIASRLDPPYEDLFDSAEEYILDVLFNVWKEMTSAEQQTFEIVRYSSKTYN